MSSLGWALTGGSLQLESLHKRHQHPILQLHGISTSYQSTEQQQNVNTDQQPSVAVKILSKNYDVECSIVFLFLARLYVSAREAEKEIFGGRILLPNMSASECDQN